jgi:hypothetical protein
MTNLTFPLFASLLTAALVGGLSAESIVSPRPADVVSGFSQAIPPEQPVVGELHQHGDAAASCCCASMKQAATRKPAGSTCCNSMKAPAKASGASAATPSMEGGCCKRAGGSNAKKQ